MADYYCENCEFFEDRSTDKLMDGYCKKYNQPLNFYDWWEKCDKCIIDTLQSENAALRARLERAVELPRKIGDTVYYLQLYCDYKGETVKHCSKKERPIMCECDEIAKRWSLPNWIYVIRERPFRLSDLSRIGKTVFLYCEEAEAKIAELRRRCRDR